MSARAPDTFLPPSIPDAERLAIGPFPWSQDGRIGRIGSKFVRRSTRIAARHEVGRARARQPGSRYTSSM